MTKLDSILKRKNITLPTKVHIAKTMVFPVITSSVNVNCTVKKTEHQRIDAFEPWCWRRLLRVPWIAKRSNQSILKEINPEYSLEGLVLKLKLHYFGHLMRRGKDPNARKDWGREEKGATGRDGWMASLTQWTWYWANSGRWWGTGKPGMLQFTGSQRVWLDLATEQQERICWFFNLMTSRQRAARGQILGQEARTIVHRLPFVIISIIHK